MHNEEATKKRKLAGLSEMGEMECDEMNVMIGPFFFTDGNITAHKIPVALGETRGGKADNPCSHEKLYDDNFSGGDYIDIPRGRVVWDTVQSSAIIYTDACIEAKDYAIAKIAELFGLDDYFVEHDEHYVCPNCMGDIWEEN